MAGLVEDVGKLALLADTLEVITLHCNAVHYRLYIVQYTCYIVQLIAIVNIP